MRAITISALLVAGCSGGASKAEDEHRIALKSATNETERCAIERKLQEAYLQASDDEKYKAQKLAADISCQSASMGL